MLLLLIIIRCSFLIVQFFFQFPLSGCLVPFCLGTWNGWRSLFIHLRNTYMYISIHTIYLYMYLNNIYIYIFIMLTFLWKKIFLERLTVFTPWMCASVRVLIVHVCVRVCVRMCVYLVYLSYHKHSVFFFVVVVSVFDRFVRYQVEMKPLTQNTWEWNQIIKSDDEETKISKCEYAHRNFNRNVKKKFFFFFLSFFDFVNAIS